jgi:hypothetical protein
MTLYATSTHTYNTQLGTVTHQTDRHVSTSTAHRHINTDINTAINTVISTNHTQSSTHHTSTREHKVIKHIDTATHQHQCHHTGVTLQRNIHEHSLQHSQHINITVATVINTSAPQRINTPSTYQRINTCQRNDVRSFSNVFKSRTEDLPSILRLWMALQKWCHFFWIRTRMWIKYVRCV